ncbi:UDP-N-acetylmuramate--L-alanine ligase [Simkania sp.]|uniref:UDP-N-acetylmuramate--L-alanine ligase n=1 Tax=Simkania sp. TaxID=34094 RepID=UPI003B51F699
MNEKTHFLGIGGIGMSALAHILLEKGEKVLGSDQSQSAVVQALEDKGAVISNEMDSESQVVFSSAIKEGHPLLEQAKKLGCPLYHRSQFLGKLMEGQAPLLVSGTHGKTSTSGLLAWVFLTAGLSPSYAVGGILNNTGQNGGYGNSKWFVAEADESDGSFLNYGGEAAILTNLEIEHLDFWKNEEKLIEGFRQFASHVQTLVWCKDDPLLASLDLQGITYGTSKYADWQLQSVHQEGMQLRFSILYGEDCFKDIVLPLVGTHQALNACAVWAIAMTYGVSEASLREAFRTFKGVKRRLEKKGEAKGVVVYDDYAHHPTEVKALLTSLKQAIGTRRLVAIFQPHRYTRTRDCMQEFATAFDAADEVYITGIYSAGEIPIEGISGERLAEQISGSIYWNKFPTFQEGDVVVTIGAGDITHLGPQILENLV